jgi:hypothetical protein
MVMEDNFHQQVCPNIDKNTTNDKNTCRTNSGTSFLPKQTNHTPLLRKGLVKLTISILFDTIGAYWD